MKTFLFHHPTNCLSSQILQATLSGAVTVRNAQSKTQDASLYAPIPIKITKS